MAVLDTAYSGSSCAHMRVWTAASLAEPLVQWFEFSTILRLVSRQRHEAVRRCRRASPYRHSPNSALLRDGRLSGRLLLSASPRPGRPSRHCCVLESVSSVCPVASLLSVLHLHSPCRCLSFSLPSHLPSPLLRTLWWRWWRRAQCWLCVSVVSAGGHQRLVGLSWVMHR